MMRRTLELIRECANCHAMLEIGETCNCARPSAVLPRDGLRASCPFFSHRSRYRGRYYITCRYAASQEARREFESGDARDAYYKTRCCWGRECIFAKGDRSKNRGCACEIFLADEGSGRE